MNCLHPSSQVKGGVSGSPSLGWLRCRCGGPPGAHVGGYVLGQTNLTARAFSFSSGVLWWAVGRLCSAAELTQLCFERVWNQLGCWEALVIL